MELACEWDDSSSGTESTTSELLEIDPPECDPDCTCLEELVTSLMDVWQCPHGQWIVRPSFECPECRDTNLEDLLFLYLSF